MKGNRIPVFLLVIILVALPLLLFGIKQTLNSRGNAAAADKLEAEGGTLGGNAISKQDSSASGGNYIEFGVDQSSQSTGIYGPGINIDSKNNKIIGGGNNAKLSHRFKAGTTSNLNYVMWAIRVNDPNKTGYAGGDNGAYRISIQTDDGTSNHLPSGIKIAEASGSPGPGDFGGTNRKTIFSNPPLLQKDQIYHVVWENTSSDPRNNYFSVNEIFTFDKLTPRQPILSDSEYAILYNSGSGWQLQSNDTADMDLGYSDGTHDGVAYLQAFYDSGQEIVARISGARMAREIFTVTGGNKTISKISVRVAHVSGNSNLNLKIVDSSGNQITSGSIANNLITIRNWANWTATSNIPTGNWITFSLPNPVSLINGATYSLILSSPADTTFAAVPIRHLDNSDGFNTPSTGMQSYAFREGKAQESLDNGSTWQDVYLYQSQSNYQFYFTTTSTPTLTSSPTPSTQPGTVYNVPTSIDKTGATDVSTALNNYISTVPSGTATNPSIITFPAYATYQMSQGIRITGNNKILDGRGTKIFTTPGSGKAGTATSIMNSSNILVGMNWPGAGSTQSNNITIHDFTLVGDHYAPGTYDIAEGGEGQANFFVGLSNGLEIYNITASKSRGDYIQFSGWGNSNAHVYNFTGTNCGRNAISFLNSTDMLVENSSWGICAYYWLDFEADNTLGGIRNTDRITVRNNTFERWDESSSRYGGGWIALSNASQIGSTDDIKIEGNKITGANHATMQVYINQNSSTRFKNISFLNNSAIQSLPRSASGNQANFVFQAKNIDGFKVNGNKQPGAGTSTGGYWFDPSLGSSTSPFNTTGFEFTNNTN